MNGSIRLCRVVALAAALLPLGSLAQAPDASKCFPACRSGFLCHEGTCVSACNPPCAAGETCVDGARCVSNAVQGSAADPAIERLVRSDVQGPLSAGWARGAGTFGYVVMAAAAAGTIGTIAFNGDMEVALSLGAVTTLFAAITIPIVGFGGASARTHPSVAGLPGWRVTGWIAYAGMLGDALLLLTLGSVITVPSPLIALVGALGIVSALSFTLDAFASADQVEKLMRQAARPPPGAIVPFFSAARDRGGAPVPISGLALLF